MDVIIVKMKSGNEEHYLQAKSPVDKFDMLSAPVVNKGLSRLSVLSEEEYNNGLSILSDEAVKTLRDRQACGIKEVNAAYPLVPGEVLESDRYTYLKEPFGDYPKYTPVLIRNTNMCEAYFIFRHAVWSEKSVNFLNADEISSRDERVPLTLKVKGIEPTSLVMELLKGFFNKMGVKVFDSLFPNFGDVDYNRINNLIRSENARSTIQGLCGEISGIERFLKNLYPISSDKRVTLEQQIDKTYTIQGKLLQEDCKLVGFSVYMDSVVLLLALYQELVSVSPAANKEILVKTVNEISVTSIKQIQDTFNALEKIRRDKFKTGKSMATRNVGGYISAYYYYYWEDTLTGKRNTFEDKGVKGDDVSKRRDDDCLAAKNKAVAEYRQLLNIDEVVDGIRNSSQYL